VIGLEVAMAYSGMVVKGLRKTTDNINQDSRCNCRFEPRTS
jgi:hypothetical protein